MEGERAGARKVSCYISKYIQVGCSAAMLPVSVHATVFRGKAQRFLPLLLDFLL